MRSFVKCNFLCKLQCLYVSSGLNSDWETYQDMSLRVVTSTGAPTI
eukprot:SAG31_NODE_34488_length_332_cov_0.995708_1_plen_45_part_10